MKKILMVSFLAVQMICSSNVQAQVPVYEQMNQIRKADHSSIVLRGDVEDIYVRVKADKTIAYAGEAIVLQYDLMTRFDAKVDGFDQETDLKDFGVFTFSAEKFKSEVRRSIFFVDKHYALQTFRKQVIFPTTSGDKKIKLGKVLVSYRVSPTLRKQMIVSTDQTLNVSISPVPEVGKPIDFSGLAGRFKEKTTLDTSELEGAGTVQLRFQVSGTGDLRSAELPIFEFPEGLSALNTQEDYTADFNDYGLVVEKIVTVNLKVEKSGSYLVPPVAISFFDTSSHRYRVISTKPISFEAANIPESKVTPVRSFKAVEEKQVPSQSIEPVASIQAKESVQSSLKEQRVNEEKKLEEPMVVLSPKSLKPLKLEMSHQLSNLFKEVETQTAIQKQTVQPTTVPQTSAQNSVSKSSAAS